MQDPAACAARRDPDFLIIARVEALIAGLGQEEALKRGLAYEQAGADAILIHSKQATPDQILSFVQAWTGKVPLVLALLVVPFEAVALPLFYGTAMIGWRDGYLVQVAPFVATALSIYLFYTFFLDFPEEVEDAATVDGAGPWRVFFQIVVPQSRPVFATVAIVTFLLHWGMYLWPLLVTTRVDARPLPLGIATFRTLPPVQWGDIMAFAVLMVLRMEWAKRGKRKTPRPAEPIGAPR